MWGTGDPRQILAQSLHDDVRALASRADRGGAAKRLLFYFPDVYPRALAGYIADYPWGDYPWRHDDRGEGLLREAMSSGHVLIRAEWLKLFDPTRPVNAQLAAFAAAPKDLGKDAKERIRALRDRSTDLEIVVACLDALPGEEAPGVFTWLTREFAKAEKRDAERTQVILAALAAIDEEASLPIFVAHIQKLENFGWGNVLQALKRGPRPKLAVALPGDKLDAKDLIRPKPLPVPGWYTEETRWCDLAATVLAEAKPEFAFDPKAPVEERDRQIAAIRAELAK
jgi:hypothetical protein